MVKIEYFVNNGKIVRAVQQMDLPVGVPSGEEYIRRLIDIANWCGGDVTEDLNGVVIQTSEGPQRTKPGYWVIERSNGVFPSYWPCHPFEIHRSYDPVEFEINPKKWKKSRSAE